MNLLQKQIKEASQQYYTDGTSKLSDAEFDALLEKERQQNPNSELLKVGHGYDIEKDTTYGQKVDHKYGLVGSLDKCHNYQEMSTNIRKLIEDGADVITSLKLDGLSCVLYYESGELVLALTRGDGVKGVTITEKAKYILNKQGAGVSIDSSFTGAIRGELVMSEDNFVEFNKLHPEAKNPRNSTAGLVNGKEITSDFDFLNLVVYTVVGIESAPFGSYTAVFDFLEKNFNEVVDHEITNKNQICDGHIEDYMNTLHDKWYGNYPADGIVIALNNLAVDNQQVQYLSLAYKFPTPVVTTTVTDIVWELSKTGYLIPRIQFNPVEIEGSTVQYCAGHNAENIRDVKVGIGSQIQVTKANSIIPYLVNVDTTKDYELPERCPSCGQKLYWSGVHLQCQNTQCRNSDIQDTLVWLEHLMAVDGLGDTLKLKFLGEMLGEDNISVEAIYQHGPLSSTTSSQVKEQLFNESFNRLFTSYFGILQAIRALNIPRLGEVTSKKLSDRKYTEDIKHLINGEEPSIALKDIGAANYNSIMKHKDKFQRLKYLGDRIIFAEETDGKDNIQAKGKVVITGKLNNYSRKDFKSVLAEHGYELSETLNKDTLFLITNTPDSSSSKNAKADKLGITKITEQDFIDTYINNDKTQKEPETEPSESSDMPDMHIINPELCAKKHITVTLGCQQDPDVPYVVVFENDPVKPKYLCCIRLDNGQYYEEVDNSPIDPYLEEFWDIMMSGWGYMNILIKATFHNQVYRTGTGYECAVQIWCNYFRPGKSIQETGLFEQNKVGIPVAPDFDVLKQ